MGVVWTKINTAGFTFIIALVMRPALTLSSFTITIAFSTTYQMVGSFSSMLVK
jgi:hypothetical protein